MPCSLNSTGFSGSSNYKYYIKDDNLYFRNISNSNNEEELLANNIKDLYLEGEDVIAVLDKDGKIVKENKY